jgi:hypothetical protein
MNTISWSDLPHTILQAKKTLNTLVEHGLAEQREQQFYVTQMGLDVLAQIKRNPPWPQAPAYEPQKKQRRKRAKKQSTTTTRRSSK